jgi:hypothetical protein
MSTNSMNKVNWRRSWPGYEQLLTLAKVRGLKKLEQVGSVPQVASWVEFHKQLARPTARVLGRNLDIYV